MHCKGKLKLKSHNTTYCLIGVVTKAGFTVIIIRSSHLTPNLSGKEKKEELIMSDCCLMPHEEVFSCVMERTSCIP